MNSKPRFEAFNTRQLIEQLRQSGAKENLAISDDEIIYIPSGHLKALDWQTSIVVGARGSGKSFWTAALFDTRGRQFLAHHPSVAYQLKDLSVDVGFGLGNEPRRFPTEDALKRWRNQHIPARTIWQAVVLRHALKAAEIQLPFGEELDDAVGWVHQRGSEAVQRMADADAELAGKGQRLLILFDSLERLAADWDAVREHATEILRVALDCRSTRAMRCKIFLRPDMNDDGRIWQFAESSKLKQTSVKLDWRAGELYALLIVSMGNEPQYGPDFRSSFAQVLDGEWTDQAGRFVLSDRFLRDEAKVRSVIEALCGTYMGSNAKRGHVYTWIPTHLADAFGRATPRSLITAFKIAAEWTNQHQNAHGLPIHYEGIHEGVRAASRTRNAEIEEDYPWVELLLSTLRGNSVPMEKSIFENVWSPIKDRLDSRSRLPPRHFTLDEGKGTVDALLQDLTDLGIVYETDDGRYNIVDIYRVHRGIGRKGGIKPPAR